MEDLRAFLDSYQDHLNDLKAPTRAAITALTMLAVEKASESTMAASGIAAVVVNHVLTVRGYRVSKLTTRCCMCHTSSIPVCPTIPAAGLVLDG